MSSATYERHAVSVARDLPVPMRDNTVLRADVYRPTPPGRYPVLVCRTPYNKAHDRCQQNGYQLASRGYIVVIQDIRGRYKSEGEFVPVFGGRAETIEQADGYDTVEWAASLKASDGRVGVFGNSYDGYTSWMAAASNPPSLKAMYSSGMSAQSLDMTFGVFDIGRRLQWTYAQAGDARGRAGLPGPQSAEEAEQKWAQIERMKWIWFLPLEELPEQVFSTFTPQLKQHIREVTRNSWDFRPLYSRIDIPICQNTGWYDRINGTINNYTGMVTSGPASVRDRHRLVIGPWGHDVTKLMRHQGVMDFGPEAATTYDTLILRWYDYLFKEIDTGIGTEPPIRLFVMGRNQWRFEHEWPLARTRFTPYFLHSTGRANTPAGDGVLSPMEPGAEPSDRYQYDPRDPIMSLMDIDLQMSPCNQKSIDDREDVLVYQTPPLEEELEITGPLTVKLWIASSAPDTDFTAKLIHVYPDGFSVNLSCGITRCRYRHGFDREELMTPDEIYEIEIRLLPTSVVLGKGHRLRLDISSSDFPNFDRNHNTGKDFWSDTELRVARQTIFHDQSRPSQIILPIIPAT